MAAEHKQYKSTHVLTHLQIHIPSGHEEPPPSSKPTPKPNQHHLLKGNWKTKVNRNCFCQTQTKQANTKTKPTPKHMHTHTHTHTHNLPTDAWLGKPNQSLKGNCQTTVNCNSFCQTQTKPTNTETKPTAKHMHTDTHTHTHTHNLPTDTWLGKPNHLLTGNCKQKNNRNSFCQTQTKSANTQIKPTPKHMNTHTHTQHTYRYMAGKTKWSVKGELQNKS